MTVRECKEVEFLEPFQGNMSVAQYEAKFTELSGFAPHMVEDDVRKAYKFEQGLKSSIHSKLSALMIQSYSGIVARTLIVEKDQEEF